MSISQPLNASPYRSFWMAGFEGADHINGDLHVLDMVRASGHDRHAEADYARLARLGILTLRESVGWRLAEPPRLAGRRGLARFDFARTQRFADAANRHGLQVLWSLMHYGMPPSVGVLTPGFADRFADYAAAAARALRPYADEAPVYTPINEINFLAWAIADTDLIHPYRNDPKRRHQDAIESRPEPEPETGYRPQEDFGFEVKCRLVQAALRGIEAIRAEDPRARFLHVEPMLHVVSPDDSPHLVREAELVGTWQYQAWDMLRGTLRPELGGSEASLDLVGVNFYHDSQWEAGTRARLWWHKGDRRRARLSQLLRQCATRYDRPVIVAETSHVGEGRAAWLEDVSSEVERARRQGVQVEGMCLYPIVDRPDWGDPHLWHHSGLWDLQDDSLERRLHLGYARTLRRWQRRLSNEGGPGAPMPHLIVFSHLRWDFVFQRPQHLLSRLARHYHVIFVEEPVHAPHAPRLEVTSPAPNVEVLRPRTPVEAPGFHDDQLAMLQPLLAGYLADNGIEDYFAWFYTPMALPLLADLDPRAVVYDCMDELSAFRRAPRQMRQREAALLRRAELVLTGGPSLYEAKRTLHPNVLCLPSAVDADHYARDKAVAREAPMARAEALQGAIAGPRLGFFGVIDERIDLDLVAAVADADPAWQVVMAGPVAKIDPARLPRRPNLHWLGQQPYDVLPQLVAGWDVCLMPFALNESTRFISPTKTLEYMAAGKPVVGTPIHDVQAMFGDVVAVRADAEGFAVACREALDATADERAEHAAAMAASVARYSWDDTAERIRSAIDEALALSPVRAAAANATAVTGDALGSMAAAG